MSLATVSDEGRMSRSVQRDEPVTSVPMCPTVRERSIGEREAIYPLGEKCAPIKHNRILRKPIAQWTYALMSSIAEVSIYHYS